MEKALQDSRNRWMIRPLELEDCLSEVHLWAGDIICLSKDRAEILSIPLRLRGV